ncbi:MAG: SCO1664 family protein [Sporichthyaceae bacterium]|nr:SCO1664 family protein [Sporichthyaceae bacterium]
MTTPAVLDHAAALRLLSDGELEVVGRLVEASNATLYCQITMPGATAACVYKPEAGERPLWDFPDGTLARREVAAYLISERTGWGLVPPTIYRDGPYGPGMVQLWIDLDTEVDLVGLLSSDDPRLRRLAVFDAVINNADRKGGHLLPTPDGHLYGVDHGVCFAVDDKLRTLLWRWAGQPLPDETVPVLERLRADLGQPAEGAAAERGEVLPGALSGPLADLLTPAEIVALAARIDRLLTSRNYPQPSPDWPAIPWPPV